MFKKNFKKADLIMLAVLVIIGLSASFALTFVRVGGEEVNIKVAGKLYGTYSLKKDRNVTIDMKGKTNIVSIKNGKVKMISASCANQVCVKHSAISKSGETIICLPNKVIVSITGRGESSYDSVSG